MKNYILIDFANLFYRAKHAVRGDIDTKIGMALHITFNSVKRVWTDHEADHVVFFLEGRSWRKNVYEPYKRNRPTEKTEEDEIFFEVFDEFKEFIREKTNCTVLQHPQLEADDLIAGWIQNHPNDKHVIISSDGDFAQLVSKNVSQYNGVSNVLTTHEGYFNDKGERIKDKKTKELKPPPNPDWLLFEKCIRGDTSDNIFSAYPGVRKKGTKNKVGLLEAFEDKETKGFNWNNLMLQRWVDHEGVEHRVIDDYKRNVMLCDLTAQPEDIRKIIDETVQTVESKDVKQVGLKLMKFCSKWDLSRIADQAASFSPMFSARYEK